MGINLGEIRQKNLTTGSTSPRLSGQITTGTTPYKQSSSLNRNSADYKKTVLDIKKNQLSEANSKLRNYISENVDSQLKTPGQIKTKNYSVPFQKPVSKIDLVDSAKKYDEQLKNLYSTETYKSLKENVDKLSKEENLAYREYKKSIEKDELPWYKTILQTPEAFKDGYDFGDVTKTVLSSAGDLALETIGGITSLGDSGAKLIASAGAQIGDWLGFDDWADEVRYKVAGKSENVNKLLKKWTPSGWVDTAKDEVNKNSVFGNSVDEVMQGAGYYAGMLALESVGVPWQATAAVSAAGNELSEAYANDATDIESWVSATNSAAWEVISEYLFGGIKLPGTGKAFDGVFSSLTENIKNKTAKFLLEAGYQMGGEGLEEVISGLGSSIGKKLTYMSDKDFAEIYSKEDALKDFVIGGAVAGLTNSVNPATWHNISSGKSLLTGRTSEEAKSRNETIQKLSTEAEQSKGRKLNSKEKVDIEDYVDGVLLDKLYSLKNDLEAAEEATEKSSLTKEIEDLQNKITEIASSTKSLDILQYQLSSQNQVSQNSIMNTQTFTTSNENSINSMLVQNSVKNSITPQQNVNPSNQVFQFTKTGNTKVDNFLQSAVNSRFNNTKQSQDFLNSYSKIIKDKGYNVIFDSTINKNGKSVNGQITTLKNGEVEIRINPNSNTSGEFLIVHEVTHAVENEGLTDFIIKYAEHHDDFKAALQDKMNLYGTDQVTSEVVADISAQVLGNQEFINSLVMENTTQSKTLIRKIYDSIKRLVNTFTSEGRYKNFVQDLEQKWREAYRTITQEQAVSNLNNETKFATQFKDILLRNKNLNSNSRIPIVNSNEKVVTTSQNSIRLQNDFKNNVKTGVYKNKATGYETSIDSDTKGKILRPNGIKTATTTQDYILRMISANNLPTLFENAVYIDTLKPMKNKASNPNELGYHHFLAPIYIDGTFYRALITGKEKQNSKKLYSLNVEILTQKNGSTPLANANSGYQLSGILPTDMSISDLVKGVNIFNYDTGQYQTYNDTDIKYSMQENENNTQELDNSSFSLKERVQGDALLGAQDLIQEIRDVGAEVDENGYVTLYHQTSDEAAKSIKDSGLLKSAGEDYVYFSTSKNAQQANGRGQTKLEFKMPAEMLILDDIFNDNADVKIPLNGKNQIDVSNYLVNNNENNLKQQQLDIILNANPAFNETSTWIRNIDDIKTFEETLQDSDWEGWENDSFDPDYDANMVKEALDTGKITVYSSYPIEQGIFVTPSKMEAESYSGTGKVYSKEVNLTDVAWIDPTQGQYAKIDVKYSQSSDRWQQYLDRHYKATGTRTNMNSIKAPTRNKGLDNSSFSFDQKQSNKPVSNEQVKANDTPLNPKQRRWVKTSTESKTIKGKVLIENLDYAKTNYVVRSNKSTLESANSKLESLGYEDSISYIRSKMSDKKIDLEDIALAERLIQESIKNGDTKTASDLIMDVAILGTELGQKVQALSIIQKLTPEGQLAMYQKIVSRAKAKGEKAYTDVNITQDMTDTILGAYNEDGTYDQNDLNERVEIFKQQVAEQLKSSKSEKINEWRYLSMLGNPKTHIRNMVSNLAMTGTIKVKNAMARTGEAIASKLTTIERTKTWKKSSDTVTNFAKQTAEEMKSVISGESKYGEKASIESKKQVFKSKTLERISDFNSNALEAEDWFFSKRAFQNSFSEYLTANGIETQQDITNNAKLIEKAKLYAVEQAEIATFRQYSKLASLINKFERNNKVAELAIGATIPFKKTPINVAKAGVNYSPIGLIKSISYDAFQLHKGNINASQFIDNVSQGMTGTALTLLGYALAKAGFVSGAGDDDKEGKMDYYLGNQSYSLKFGKTTFPISWVSPVAMPFLVGANAYEKLENQEEWDANIVIDTLAQTLDPLSEMSFISSLTDVLQSYNQGSFKMLSSMGTKAAQSYIGQFFPTLFSQIAATFDDTKRSTSASKNSSFKVAEETVRQIMYKIPGLRNMLEPSTNIWGEEQKQSDNIFVRAFNNFINPSSPKSYAPTKLENELKRVYRETGDSSVIPGIPYGNIKYKGINYQMSSEEYTKYKKTYGQNAKQKLTVLIDNDDYKKATDEQKAKMIDQVFDFSKAIANEEYFKSIKIDFSSDNLKTIKELKELGFSDKTIIDYTAKYAIINSIKQDKTLTSEQKQKNIASELINSNFNNKELAYMYDKAGYSKKEKLDALITMNIPIKEFIKLDSSDISSDYDTSTGKAITNSKKNKYIKYVDSLKLSTPQKAILIKMQYNSYNNYNDQIVKYIDSLKETINDKKILLTRIGFDDYRKEVINYVMSKYKNPEERIEMLKQLGYTIRNGRVYW